MEQVLTHNPSAKRPLPLKGMAIGNGVVGSDVGDLAPYFNFEWFHGHGQFCKIASNRKIRDRTFVSEMGCL